MARSSITRVTAPTVSQRTKTTITTAAITTTQCDTESLMSLSSECYCSKNDADDYKRWSQWDGNYDSVTARAGGTTDASVGLQ